MNKKFLAIAVAAAMAPAAASADVKLYGIAQVEYNVEDRDCTGCDSVQGVDDAAGRSRIGIKWSEKLGGGLTAFGKAEFRVDPADNSDSGTAGSSSAEDAVAAGNPKVSGALGQRDFFVGIKGSFGSIVAGSVNAPYKVAGGVKWDPMAATHLQARRAGGMSGGPGIGGHNGFMRNAIQYTSPDVNGFQVAFAISPDETNSSGTRNDTDDGDNDYSISLSYKNGPWHAIAAHNRNNNGTGTSAPDDETLTKVGLRWKSGALTLAGQYEWINDADRSRSGNAPHGGYTKNGSTYSSVGATGEDGDIYWLNAQYKVGNNIFTASYGNTEGDDSDIDNDYWMVGVIHKFSKKTRIFGGYSETDIDDSAGPADGDREVWSVGIRQDF